MPSLTGPVTTSTFASSQNHTHGGHTVGVDRGLAVVVGGDAAYGMTSIFWNTNEAPDAEFFINTQYNLGFLYIAIWLTPTAVSDDLDITLNGFADGEVWVQDIADLDSVATAPFGQNTGAGDNLDVASLVDDLILCCGLQTGTGGSLTADNTQEYNSTAGGNILGVEREVGVGVQTNVGWTFSGSYGALLGTALRGSGGTPVSQTMGASAEHLAGVEASAAKQAEHLGAIETTTAVESEHLAELEVSHVGSAEHVTVATSAVASHTEHLVLNQFEWVFETEHLGATAGVSKSMAASAEHLLEISGVRTASSEHLEELLVTSERPAEHLVDLVATSSLSAEHTLQVESLRVSPAEHQSGLEVTVVVPEEHRDAPGQVSKQAGMAAEHLSSVVDQLVLPSEHALQVAATRVVSSEHIAGVAVSASRALGTEHLAAVQLLDVVAAEHTADALPPDLTAPFTAVWVDPARTLSWS